MSKYEKINMNYLNNTNTSINFIMDSLNKTDFEIIKQINKKSKEKIKRNLLEDKNKKFRKTYFLQNKAHNKLESFILSSKKSYSKYNKIPHQTNKLIN